MKFSRTIRILLLGANLWYFSEGMLGPLFAVFTQKVGGDLLDITWAWGTYLVITGSIYILVGKFLNGKAHKVRIMILGYILNALLTFGYLLVSNPLQLFIVQVGLGIAEAIGTPIWDSLYAKHLDESIDTYAWGLSAGQSHIVAGIAFAIGGFIIQFISFKILFVMMGMIQILAAIVTAQLLLKQKNNVVSETPGISGA